MKRKYTGLVLILMMLGHNYVINQPQSLQQQIQQIHHVSVTQFNLLYSIPSILAILTIIPVGILYLKHPNFTLMFGITMLFIGQLLASMFGSEGKQNYFAIFVGGRTLEASGAQILYMIQGNLASSWMGNFAGLVFILPEIGQIINAFLTPYAAINWGSKNALLVGVIFCFISMIACCILYCELKKRSKIKKSTKIQMVNQQGTEKSSSSDLSRESSSNRYSEHKKLQSEESSRQSIPQIQHKSLQKIKTTSERQSKEKSSDQQLTNKKQVSSEPESIFKAGKVFWLTILICALNECLYFPFLDNANELIQTRFKIPYSQTGYFLCLPFCAAILTTMAMSKVLGLTQRKNLIFYCSLLPFFGHLMIMLLPNCEEASLSLSGKLLLGCGFFIFGTGIGGYYSVSFPAVGMAVPQKIRGLSYGVLCFFQTLAMSLVPILSGLIIEQDVTNPTQGYTNSSLMFVGLTLVAVIVALLIRKLSNEHSYRYDDEEQLVEQEQDNPQQMEISNQNIQIKSKKNNNIKYETIQTDSNYQKNQMQ